MGTNLKSLYLLDPNVTYLNHGSFGACPKPVFDAYQRWQRELELEPFDFLARRSQDLMIEARVVLAEFLGCEHDEVVYFPNPTTAINMVARSLDLGPGDEILTSDHEYGAMDRTWTFICRTTGARYLRRPIGLPVNSTEDLLEAFWEGFGPRTRVVFLSHITSPTALTFPAEEVCRRAREAGVVSIIDGAHTPGHIPLHLPTVGADIYTGACHKWLGAPKGAAFLYARQEVQHLLQPLVVSWGWESEKPSGSTFVDHHEWQGTRDPAAFLAVPEAIRFQEQHNWTQVRDRCQRLAVDARRELHRLTGLDPICPESQQWFTQMFAAPLPSLDAEALQDRLWHEHQIEVAAHRWKDQPLIRVSIQAYNDAQDVEILIQALQNLLPERDP